MEKSTVLDPHLKSVFGSHFVLLMGHSNTLNQLTSMRLSYSKSKSSLFGDLFLPKLKLFWDFLLTFFTFFKFLRTKVAELVLFEFSKANKKVLNNSTKGKLVELQAPKMHCSLHYWLIFFN